MGAYNFVEQAPLAFSLVGEAPTTCGDERKEHDLCNPGVLKKRVCEYNRVVYKECICKVWKHHASV